MEKCELIRCAEAIRKELRERFPLVKFSVRSERFSMGNAVNVRFPESSGLDQRAINSILSKYAYGTFDGMNDSAGVKPENGLPRAKFVSAYPVRRGYDKK